MHSASGESESLAAMERDVTVGAGEQGRLLRRLEVAVDELDVGSITDLVAQLVDGLGTKLRVDRLDQKSWPLIRSKRAAERLDEPDRVLAAQRAEEVEHEQEREAVVPGQRELDVGHVGHGNRHRNDDDRDGRQPAEILGDESRVDPDLIEMGERGQPTRRQHIGLPAPLTDVRTIAQQARAARVHEGLELVAIETDEVERGLDRRLVMCVLLAPAARDRGGVAAMDRHVRADARRRNRYPRGGEPLDVEPGRLGESQGLREVADDIDPEPEPI